MHQTPVEGAEPPGTDSADGEPTDDGAAAVDEAPDRPPPGWLVSTRVLAANALALLVVLLALIPIVGHDAISVPDEGIYSAQAQNLAEGSWSSPRTAPEVDPDGRLDGLVPGLSGEDAIVPHYRNPLYPSVLGAVYRVGGTAGLVAVSAVSVWAAAVLGALLARRLNPAYAVPTLWILGVGSPLVFSATVVMAHGPAAAACAALLLAVAGAVDDHRRAALVPAILAAAVLPMLRSEGLLVALAVGLVVGASALRRRGLDLWRVAVGASVLAMAGLGHLLSNRWSARIATDLGAAAEVFVVPSERDPLAAAWIALLRPWFTGFQADVPLLLAIIAVVVAAVALRLAPSFRLLPLALLVLAAPLALVAAWRSYGLVTGLLPAFPALAAIIFLTREDLLRAPVRRLVAVSVLAGGATVATIYSDGGSTQWGGRFFHVLLPALVPLTVLGLDRARQRLEPKEAAVAGVALAVVLVSLSAVALRANHSARGFFRVVVQATLEEVREGDGTRQLVLYGGMLGDGTSRGLWEHREQVEVLNAGGLRNVALVVSSAADVGYDRVIVISDLDPNSLEELGADRYERIGWGVTSVRDAGVGLRLVSFASTD